MRYDLRMTSFLIVTPRTPEQESRTEDIARIAADSFDKVLGPRYAEAPTLRNGVSATGAVLVEWRSTDQVFVYRIGRRWVASTAPETGVSLIRSVRTPHGRVELDYPVWGSYMAIAGDYDSDRIVAWNTVPAIEAVHYAEDRDFLYISNRPMAIALAKSGGEPSRIELEEDYLLDSLSFGFAVSDATPFRGVHSAPATSAVAIYRGGLSLIPGPKPEPREISVRQDKRTEGADELFESLNAATKRLLQAQPTPEIQLRLSGGQDSRLVLGLLKQHGLENVTAVTQGDESSEEVHVAARLAELAGVKHRVVRPSLNDPLSVERSYEESLRISQGQFLSEALGAPYAFADPFKVGEGYAAGQWPMFKDMYVGKSRLGLTDLVQELQAHNAGFLMADLNRRAHLELEKWAASVGIQSNADMLYLYGLEIRASKYFQASNIAVDAFSKTLFPFMDSEVVAVSDGLGSSRRRSQVPMFLAMQKLWPEAMQVPLARGGRFRFERWSPLEGISGEHYESRVAEPRAMNVNVTHRDYLGSATDRFLLDSPLVSGSRYLLDSSSWDYLRDILSEEFRGRVYRLASLETEIDALKELKTRGRRVHTQLYIARLILADKWLSRTWLGAA